MRTTPLESLSHGAAAMVAMGGVSVPAHFGDPLAEARVARAGAALCDRSHRGRILARGEDRVSFLQGQTTNDVNALKPGDGCLALVLTGKGKLRGDVRVACFPEHLLLDLEGAVAGAVKQHLERFIIMEDVVLEDVSEATAALLVTGPTARLLVESVLGRAVPPLSEAGWVEIQGLALMGDPAAGMEGLMILGEPRPVDDLARVLLERGAGRMGELGFEALRIEAGLPRWGHEMDEDTLPGEVGLEHALSYTKGCYTGQETMARIKNFGHVNRRLVGLSLCGDELPAPGATLEADGKVVGRVTSATVAPMLDWPVALGIVRRESGEPGTRLDVVQGSQRLSAQVATLPFWRRE